MVFASLVTFAAIYARLVSAAPMSDSKDMSSDSWSSTSDGMASSDSYSSISDGMPSSNSYSSQGGSSGSYSGDSSWDSSNDNSWDSSYSKSGDYYASSSSSSAMATVTALATSTYSSSMSYETASYGSGSSSWGGSGYANCVQQCVASYGAPMATYTPTSSSSYSGSSSGSSGSSGATHTIIVAPTQGILRYVPFTINASVGDTVMFMWGANNHTVTKSSELTPCNKSTDAPVFATGEQNKSFIFSQVVNDTNSTFFYCGTPGHCPAGMFGIINPPNADVSSSTSVASMMANATANNSTMAAMAAYAAMQTSNNTGASTWGQNIDMANMPDWAQDLVLQNVLYTQMFAAANPETLDTSGNVNLGAMGSNPVVIPMDITSAFANNAANSASTSASSSSVTPATSAVSSSSASASASSNPSPVAAASTNGAGVLASPRAIVAVAVVAVTLFAL